MNLLFAYMEVRVLKGKVVLITGASRGIGAATAIEMAGLGASIAVNYSRSEDAAVEVVRRIRESGGTAIAVKADVTVCQEIRAMVGEVEQKLGPIDVLVSNAAIGFPSVPFIEYEWRDFEAKLTGELKAAFWCAKSVLPSMLERKCGSIIFVSSTLSRHPGFGFVAHSTAKSGLDAFAKSLAEELGPSGIRVNVVAPGLTITEATERVPQQQKELIARFTPLRRNGQPEDIAGAIALLASDHAKFLTGNYITADGGAYKV